MKPKTWFAVSSMVICLLGAATSMATINVVTVPVGNAGNTADTTGFGAVGYPFSISEYDVTSTQYTSFLNAVAATDSDALYNTAMAGPTHGNPGIVRSGTAGNYTYSVVPSRGSHPVTDVSYWSASRFANWLANGQPNGTEGAGTTDTGTYTLTPAAIAANSVTRNANATWALPAENEWYKAAYYSPTLNNGAGGYWNYPTQSNTISFSQANYGNSLTDTTLVGSYPYPSYYDTYDEGGNVWQWNESVYNSSNRGIRGDAFDVFGFVFGEYIASQNYTYGTPTGVANDVGFRVVLVPEPSLFGVFLALAVMLSLGKKSSLRQKRFEIGERNGDAASLQTSCVRFPSSSPGNNKIQ